MYSWKFYLPIVRLRPLSSFLPRLKLKISKIRFRLVHYFLGPIFGLTGATDIGLDGNGCRILRLNTKTILGNRGSLLHVPKDSGIYEHVRINGVWQEKEVKFFAEQMRDLMGFENNCNLVDVGSNVGLFSRSVANIVSTHLDLTLVEPLRKFVQASKENLKEYESFCRVEIYPVALSNDTSQAQLFIQSNNFGNSSLYKTAMEKHNFSSQNIEVTSANRFFKSILNPKTRYFLKIDTQGSDAFIISQLNEKLLESTSLIMFEMWALPDLDVQHVRNAVQKLRKFNSFYMWINDIPQKVEIEHLEEIWLEKSSRSLDVVAR